MTAEISHDPWAALDELLGVEAVEPVEEGIGPVAFYGRCSTEDNQWTTRTPTHHTAGS